MRDLPNSLCWQGGLLPLEMPPDSQSWPCTFFTPCGVTAETRRGLRCGGRELHALRVVNDCFALGPACRRNPVVEVNEIARWKMGRERPDALALAPTGVSTTAAEASLFAPMAFPKCRACKLAAPRRRRDRHGLSPGSPLLDVKYRALLKPCPMSDSSHVRARASSYPSNACSKLIVVISCGSGS
jgi:hypothetical protein